LDDTASDYVDAAGNAAALWHVTLETGELAGDEEDLELHEVLESLVPLEAAPLRPPAGAAVDDDETEDDETFTVELENPTNAKIHPEERVATVTIIDDDSPGTIQFAHTEVDGLAAEYRVKEECGSVLVKVSRVGGSAGTVSVNYATKEASATKDVDYMHVEGTLIFETGEVEKVIEVEIVDDDAFEKDEKFYINLSDPEGCSMGSISTAVVVIENDDEMSKLAEKVAFLLKLNLDRQKAAGADWKGQFTEAVEWPEGGGIAVVLHVLSLPWKILFAFTPPTRFLGGWLCFFVALVFIALVTALIGDLASLFGCSVGLQDSITAITFVALGTSLPDTFASKTAVEMDSNADNSIGNVTGSNSVNVFLGLGFPWLVAAIYWQNAGATPEWLERVGASGQAGAQVIAKYPQGAFFVPAGDLTFSVIVFSVCAITTLGLLVFRRIKYGAELGGPMAYPHSMTCVFLWFLYITLSILNTTGAI
jgi:solute carrier family 8 (sodium/calcium exchanger)